MNFAVETLVPRSPESPAQTLSSRRKGLTSDGHDYQALAEAAQSGTIVAAGE
jgi:hypothetical protein